jgi:hypothetical protein
LTQLEASVAQRSGEFVMAGDLKPAIAARLHRRLEAIEMEIELLREALDGSDRS